MTTPLRPCPVQRIVGVRAYRSSHEWRQRWVPSHHGDWPPYPDGFYCVHCRAIEKEATE